MAAKPKYGFCEPGMGHSWADLRDFWVEAENLGFESGTMMDNLIYTGLPDSQVRPTFETWTVLPALAEITSTIQIGPQVTPCLRRAPALFAKMITQVDHISDGRVYVGLGVGDMPKYHLPWGMPFPPSIPERAKILREEIEVMKLMWTEDKANYQGEYYHLDAAEMLPKPIQKGGPPLYIGINMGTRITPRIATDLCDGVLIYNGSQQASVDLLGHVKRHCEASGRDYDSFYKGLTVSVQLLEDESDRSYVDAINWDLPDGAPPREYLAEWNTVSLDEQQKFARSIIGAAKMIDETDLALPEGVAPPRKGYNMSSIANRFIIGTPEQVVDGILEVAEIGLDEIFIQGLGTMENLQIFGTKVLPKLQA